MKRATVNTWSRCHATDEAAVILKEKSYHKQDDQQTLVDEEDVIDGYRYGTTLVPFSGTIQIGHSLMSSQIQGLALWLRDG